MPCPERGKDIKCQTQEFDQFFFGLFLFFVLKQQFVKKILFNSSLNDERLDQSKLKAVVDDKIKVIQKMIFDLRRAENVGKGENAGYQHIILFSQCSQKLSFSSSLKIMIVWKRVKPGSNIFHIFSATLSRISVSFESKNHRV